MSCRRAAGAAACLLSFAVFSSCQKKITGPPPRYVVVRFENLTGDASLEWTGRAAAEVLARTLSGALDGPMLNPAALNRTGASLGFRPSAAPGISSQHTQAIAAGATRIVSGYVERTGSNIRIAASEEDIATGRTVARFSATGSTPLGTLASLSHEFSPSSQRYLTSSQEALKLYTTGLEEDTTASGATLEHAVQADPNFGPAWVLLVSTNVARGNFEAARSVIDRARRQKLDQYDDANIDLAEAALTNNQSARVAALRKISAMSPGDTVLLRSVAETEASMGQFEAAAGDWNKLAAILPNDINAWNQLGYARAWSGDYSGALAAFKEYARLAPNDPNPLDSTGDVQYMYRKFADAAASYLQANAKDAQFLKGGDFYKAAWAKFKAGDRPGADALFAQFRAFREKAGDTTVPLFYADWLYRTGRRKDAVALLRKAVASAGSSPSSAPMYAQLATWDLLEGDRTAAAKDAEGAGRPTSAGVLAVRFAAMPSASAAEWEARVAKMMPSPSMAAPRTLALGYALLLDGKKSAAMPYFEKLMETAPGTDFFLRAVYAKLKGEQPEREVTPDATRVNEFGALLDKL